MKNKTTLIMSALVLLSMVATACTSNSASKGGNKSGGSSTGPAPEDTLPSEYDHDHDFASDWSYDADFHWHKCTVKTLGVPCDEKDSLAAHEWDAGTVVTAASAYKPGTKRYTCSTCGKTKVVDIPAEGGNEAKGNFTFNDSELSTAQEIHTENQLGYLSLDKPYYTMTGSDLNKYSATGSSNPRLPKESWAPKAVTVNWNYSAPSGKTVTNYNFVFGQKADLSDAYQLPNAVTTNSVSFTNAFLGTNYFKVIANLSDGSKEASDIKTFKVTEQAPRNLDVGNMPNCRDMGGRTTYAGGKIKQGLIYRTSGSKFDNSTPSDNDAKSILLDQLRVRTEINVANSTTNNVNLTGVTVKDCYMDYGSTPYSNIARNAEKIRNVLNILSDESNYPVFYHCRIGTDRTGITGVILGGLLGIKFNEIIQDYGFSNFSPIDNQRYPHKTPDSNGDDIAKYIDEIIAMPGATFQEKTYHALRSIGIPASQLNKIIDIMTEGNKANLSDGGKIGSRSWLVSDGETDATGNNSFDAPEVYFPITTDESVSYEANFTSGEKDIVVYLGSTEASDNIKLADCLELRIDDEEMELASKKSMHEAGFGKTQQNSRTGYMFNLLGKYELDAGLHKIQVVCRREGLTFNVASIGVFDHVEATETYTE